MRLPLSTVVRRGLGGGVSRLILALFLSSPLLSQVPSTSAFTAMQSGNYTGALAIWNQLIQREPEYVTAINNRGYCNLMLGNYDAASDDYLKADAISQNLDSKAGVQWSLLGAEKYGESLQWGKAALTIDPNNFWVKWRMAAAYKENGDSAQAENLYADLIDHHGARAITAAPQSQLIPYFQSIQFSGSRLKASGYDAGAFALWNFNSGIALGAGYAQSNITDPSGGIGYGTKEAKIHTGFLFSDLSEVRFTGHYLSSNYALLDSAVTLSAAYKSNIFSQFTLAGDVLLFPEHKGAALTPQYRIPIMRTLALDLSASVQAIRFSQVMNFYAAGGAALSYCLSALCLSGGALYGKLYTPLFENGAILTYSLDELTLQSFARLAWKPSPYFEISGAYTYGRWKSLNGDTPTSGTFSFAATGSLF